LKLVDTSVVVAAFASWHELHGPAMVVLEGHPGLPAQSALETYSVLTRLPPPHRASPIVVRDFLAANFSSPYLSLAPEALAKMFGEFAGLGIVGGAAYDALIAALARDAGGTLVTCDRRARLTYERIRVDVEFLAAD
jgi:predicted nucleic acid-binding protein